jgi:hypothetical protein
MPGHPFASTLAPTSHAADFSLELSELHFGYELVVAFSALHHNTGNVSLVIAMTVGYK